MQFLLSFLLILGLITVAGHGIWVLLAKLFGALSESESSARGQRPPISRQATCARCGRLLLPGQSRCATCGQEQEASAANELLDLQATIRQVVALRKAGSLEPDLGDRLLACIEARLKFLAASPSPAAAVAKPAKPITPEKVPPGQSETLVAEALPEVIPVVEHVSVQKVSEPQRESARTPTRADAALAPSYSATLPPSPPRRSLAEMLAAFMEERNIFWGELVGGLLMVGCSIALVLYLWNDLRDIPYFQFLIFVGTTATIFAAGLYALHRLKLETTSRGLLVIATLLIPLNFVVMAGLAGQEAEADFARTFYRLSTEILSVVIFTALMRPAARALVGEVRWPLILAVLGISVSQLAVPRLLDRGQDAPFVLILLGCLPVACYGASMARVLYQMSRRRPLDERRANALFTFLGMATFPLIVALGFLVYWTGSPGLSLERLSVLVAGIGVPILAAGLLVHTGLAEAPNRNSGTRTAGTAVALAGMAVLLVALILAWPQPLALLLVCALNFLVLTVVGFVGWLPAAHAVALGCLTVGYLTAFHALTGHLAVPDEELGPTLRNLMISAPSGSALVFLVLLLGVAAEWLLRAGSWPHAGFYAGGSAILALVSLSLVNLKGLEDPATAGVVTGIYATGSLAMNLRWRRPAISYFGLALTLITTLWGLWWHAHEFTPFWGTLLAAEALVMVAVAVWLPSDLLTKNAWRDLAAVAGCLAFGMALGSMNESTLHSVTGSILAATALLLAGSYRAALLTWVGSALVLGSLVHTLRWSLPNLNLPHPRVAAFLAHATLVLAGSLLLKRAESRPLRQIFAEPLYQSALAVSLLALPLLAFVWGATGPAACYLAWLAVVWLVIGWTSRWPVLFAAFQAALTAAVLTGITVWLKDQPWVRGGYPEGLLDPRSLQAYGIGLSVLGLLWIGARLTLRLNPIAQKLLEPAWPTVDRITLGTVVLGQLALAVWGIMPGILLELTPADLQHELGSWPAFYAQSYGVGAWAWLALTMGVLVVALWGTQQAAAVLGLVIVAATAPVLIAGPFEEQLATASALRWGMAIYFLACSVPLWLRDHLALVGTSLGCPAHAESRQAAQARQLLLASSVVPVLVLTTVVALVGFNGRQLPGPSPGSFFAEIGWISSNVTPLLLVSLGLTGHAVRERSAGYAFAAGLVVDAAVMGGYALGIVTNGMPFGAEEAVRVVQLGTISAALWALAWLASRPWVAAWREGSHSGLARVLMTLQVGLGAAGNALLLLVAFGMLVVLPPGSTPWFAEVGSPLGWLALSLTMAAALWHVGEVSPGSRGHVLAALGLAMGVLAACSASPWDPQAEWLAYHLLLTIWTGTGLVILAAEHIAPTAEGASIDFTPIPQIAAWLRFSPAQFRGWLNGIGLLVLGLALRGTWEDPARPFWSGGATLAVSAMAGAVALKSRLPQYVYLSGLLINLAGFIAWVAWGPPTAMSFGYTQVLCFAVAAGVWTVIELLEAKLLLALHPAHDEADSPGLGGHKDSPYPYEHVAGVLAVALLGLLVTISVAADLAGDVVGETGLLPWHAVFLTAVALAIGLWTPAARHTLAALYASGFFALGLALHDLALDPPWLAWTAALVLASYVLLATVLGWAAPRHGELWQALRLPPRPLGWPEAWFPPAQAMMACLAATLSVWISLSFEAAGERLAGSLTAFLLLLAGAIFSSTTPGRWAAIIRYGTLVLGVAVVTEVGWALLGPESSAPWLYRSILLMVALALMTLVYGLGLARMLPGFTAWAESSRRIGPVLGALAALMLLVILVQEGVLFDWAAKRTHLDIAAIVVVMLAFVGMVTASINFAVIPGQDPLGLSDRGRRLYVYAAEGFFVLLLIHTRLTVPELFGGIFQKYWTLIVMAVAFLGVGLSEFFNRRALPVLAEPLQQTGILLPLLPLLAFWLRVPAFLNESAGLHYGKYALVWSLLGLLCTLVAISKRSFRFAFLAALAANFGLWSLLYHHDLSFLRHPQMWLIPFALIVLVAEEVNRDRLNEQQRGALRYLALLVIYISSTADMFIAGLGHSIFLPLILAVLSILGVLIGILLRVRAFLYLGVTFLFVVIFSMIWHAAVGQQHIWVWWASGIVLGAAIITLFAIFEKRRNDVLRVLEQIRKWD